MAEVLFQPRLAGRELLGLHELVHKSIQKCELTLHRDLYSSIVLSGGSTMFPFFDQRLAEEVKSLCPPAMKPIVKVVAPHDRGNLVWRGGSILASMAAFQKMWITKHEFVENGSSCVHSCS